MLTDTTTERMQAAAGNLPRSTEGDAEMEAPRSARPRRPRGVGAAAARLALVAGLAVALLVGALALGPHREAAAVYNCETVYALGDFNNATGWVYFAYGRPGEAEMAFETASAWYSYADAMGCS